MRWALLLATWLQAAAVITLDTQANAKLATSNANESTMIAKLQESLRLYGQLISHAQTRLIKLNQIQNILERTERFMHASALPPQKSMLKSLDDQMARLQTRQAHLNALTQRYSQLEQRRRAHLEGQCPWLDFKQGAVLQHTSQEAQDAQDFLNFLKTMSHHASLERSVLAEFVCEVSLQMRDRHTRDTQIQAMQNALLQGDFKRYHALQHHYAQARLASKNTQLKHTQATLASLSKRTEQMHQFLTPTTLQVRLHDLDNALKTQLQEAKDESAQARAYSQYAQQAQALQLELLLELTRQLHFLNETMALSASFLGKTWPALLSTSSIKLNSYGLPELSTP
ncbi:hypothetical protein [Helicobacter salomonis]|uniref:hypothetical protein n=1 Tax=Helicobacter salomonis TaxID=56878 RepID=UPI0013150B74|nr:hypothetical protein [Helicobacter salomonis]